MPKWMTALDSFTPAKSAGLAALLAGVNPKNLLLTVSAAMTIAQADNLSGGQQIASMLTFMLLASVSVLAPLVVYLSMGSRASDILSG